MKTVDQVFAKNKIVPVVVIDDLEAAIPLAHALLEAGVDTMEVTLRTTNALKVIEKIASAVPEMIISAGTILNSSDFLNAANAGAKYIISPGVTAELYTAAKSRSNGVCFIPGVCTPSHAMEASANGFNFLKFFPAEPYNAYQVIKALAAPLPQIKFCPTGGITVENMSKYLELDNIFAVGLSSIVEGKLIANHDFTEINRRCKDATLRANQIISAK